MKRQAKTSGDPLYRYLHEMTDEQLIAALHELADRIEGQALIASKSMPTNGLPGRDSADPRPIKRAPPSLTGLSSKISNRCVTLHLGAL